ncbi:hypothetical protein A2U01_0011180, partial [Trifolium medium]|nr:hypothetical protein [Trifolium medium]
PGLLPGTRSNKVQTLRAHPQSCRYDMVQRSRRRLHRLVERAVQSILIPLHSAETPTEDDGLAQQHHPREGRIPKGLHRKKPKKKRVTQKKTITQEEEGITPKKRVEAIEDKGEDINEDGRDPGKRPFVAAITGGFTKLPNSPTRGEPKIKEIENKSLTTTSIIGGPSNPKGRSGGTTKRWIAEMCSVKTDTANPKKGGRLVLGFNDDEYPGGTPNEIFPLIVIATMAHHDVSRILIDQGSSCDVMYQELLEKLGMKKEDLSSNEGTDLQGFNGSTIRP